MSVLALLSKWGLKGGPALVKALEWIIANVPDEAAAAQHALDELNQAVGPVAMARLGVTVVKELGDVVQLHFEGRPHASSGA